MWRVKNTGARASDEVVQAYVENPEAPSLTAPFRNPALAEAAFARSWRCRPGCLWASCASRSNRERRKPSSSPSPRTSWAGRSQKKSTSTCPAPSPCRSRRTPPQARAFRKKSPSPGMPPKPITASSPPVSSLPPRPRHCELPRCAAGPLARDQGRLRRGFHATIWFSAACAERSEWGKQ